MRIVIQRVSRAKVEVAGELISETGRGLMILVGVETGDTADDARWLADKAQRCVYFRVRAAAAM